MVKNIEKYITEATADNTVAKMIQKEFGVKVKKINVKRKITFQLSEPLDERKFSNFDKIDGIHELLQKYYKGSTTEHDWDKFVVEEL
jgi:hypothetical protein